MLDVNDFDQLKIGLATADSIRMWSNGEVKKPETINYRTLKPEKDGLFCEKIFGPQKDWECACGKYKRVRFKGIICERCGVEVTRSKVRRERMGHIELAAPCVHIWYLRGTRSWLAYLLMGTEPREELKAKQLEKVIYFAASLVVHVDEEKRDEDLPNIEAEVIAERDAIIKEMELRLAEEHEEVEKEIAQMEADGAKDTELRARQRSADKDFAATREQYEMELDVLDRAFDEFKDLFARKILEDEMLWREMADRWGEYFEGGMGADAIAQLIERIDFDEEEVKLRAAIDPEEGVKPLSAQRKQKAIKRLKIVAAFNRRDENERRINDPRAMILDVVPVIPPELRPMVQLEGRFRQNLLGKRVDYSGRSVIVVGPTLKFHQCGLPKIMALELFKPFVMKRLVDQELAQNIKSAKRMVERRRPQVWEVLEEVIQEHPVMLNRAPTLHRLGIQAFEPVLVEGKAIQIHPLVCTAFNADFDGDQMAVHLPLSAEAQAEARVLMLSANNVLSPAHGRPLVTPTQDMVIGAFYLTESVDDDPDAHVPTFRREDEVERSYEAGDITLHQPIFFRRPDLLLEPANGKAAVYARTTAGRVFFNEALPEQFPFVNHLVKKRDMGVIVDELATGYPKAEVGATLDRLKTLAFKFAMKSGLTVSVDDVQTPAEKKSILDLHEAEADKIESQYLKGIITDGERRQKEVEIWTNATDEVRAAMEVNLKSKRFNPIDMMVGSGARGNMMQVRQIAGMRGLVANPRGDMIPRPIKSNFRRHTGEPSDASDPDARMVRTYVETRLYSRVLADDQTLVDGTVIAKGTMVTEEDMEALRDDPEITSVRVLSPLTDDSPIGISAASYGTSLATGKVIEVGEAVGVIAAQSIGEPGTQLTMRTFHTGGVAGGADIAGGLPRVVELFEARSPKGKATLARVSGIVRVAEDEGKGKVITVVTDDGDEDVYTVPLAARLEVVDGQEITAGEPIVDGPRDPKELLEIRGIRETQQYLVEEVQKVYRDQGVSIHDKHIELIVRQMTRRVGIHEPGESDFLPGERVDQWQFADANKRLVQEGGRPAEGRPEIMGITKASLATDSWLSAASFQETTRVLTEAAIEGKSDSMIGLKENIIIGKLIPAGTGLMRHRELETSAPDYEPMEFFSSEGEEVETAQWLASVSNTLDAAPEPTIG